MPIEVVLIVGGSNNGKSTLLRALTGHGNDSHRHDTAPRQRKNILALIWAVAGTKSEILTLCLNGSLNEGWLYPKNETRFNPDAHHRTVAPWDVGALLDRYEDTGCKRAVLCISSSVNEPNWLLMDYQASYNNGGFGGHKVTHVLSLNDADNISAHFNGAQHSSCNGRAPANFVSAWARAQIGLL